MRSRRRVIYAIVSVYHYYIIRVYSPRLKFLVTMSCRVRCSRQMCLAPAVMQYTDILWSKPMYRIICYIDNIMYERWRSVVYYGRLQAIIVVVIIIIFFVLPASPPPSRLTSFYFYYCFVIYYIYRVIAAENVVGKTSNYSLWNCYFFLSFVYTWFGVMSFWCCTNTRDFECLKRTKENNL